MITRELEAGDKLKVVKIDVPQADWFKIGKVDVNFKLGSIYTVKYYSFADGNKIPSVKVYENEGNSYWYPITMFEEVSEREWISYFQKNLKVGDYVRLKKSPSWNTRGKMDYLDNRVIKIESFSDSRSDVNHKMIGNWSVLRTDCYPLKYDEHGFEDWSFRVGDIVLIGPINKIGKISKVHSTFVNFVEFSHLPVEINVSIADLSFPTIELSREIARLSSSDASYFTGKEPDSSSSGASLTPDLITEESSFKIGDIVVIDNLKMRDGLKFSGEIGHIGRITKVNSSGFFILDPYCNGGSWPASCLRYATESEIQKFNQMRPDSIGYYKSAIIPASRTDEVMKDSKERKEVVHQTPVILSKTSKKSRIFSI